jgi:Ca-activated chloride channel family protein
MVGTPTSTTILTAASVATVFVVLARLAAEYVHARRTARVARLAFGPGERPAWWARTAPWLRTAAAGAVSFGLVTLLLLPPTVRRGEETPENLRRRLVLVLDVSPSMRLVDAGPDAKQSRAARVTELLKSFFARIPIEQYRTTIVATYTEAKPVVIDTADLEVVRNILEDLPMHYAFQAGPTDLIAGVREAAKLAQPWRPHSTTLVLLTDGDTIPATGMPALPDSIDHALVVGVGDPAAGRFIDGHMSRQDVSTLQQLAVRLRGHYHNGNAKHLGSELVRTVAFGRTMSLTDRLTLREYALTAVAIGGAVLGLLPWLLSAAGTGWKPGRQASRNPAGTSLRGTSSAALDSVAMSKTVTSSGKSTAGKSSTLKYANANVGSG